MTYQDISENLLVNSFLNSDEKTRLLIKKLENSKQDNFQIEGLRGSSFSILLRCIWQNSSRLQIVILPEKEKSIYFANDLESLLNETDKSFREKKILIYPSSTYTPYDFEHTDNSAIQMRTEVLKRIASDSSKTIVFTYPEAVSELVMSIEDIKKKTIRIKKNEVVDFDFFYDLLTEYGFIHTDFVIEPGQFSVRGGIFDVFSYNNDIPYRIEFSDNSIASIRSFSPESQLSLDLLDHITIVPNLQNPQDVEKRFPFFSQIPSNSIVWLYDSESISEKIHNHFEKSIEEYINNDFKDIYLSPEKMFLNQERYLDSLNAHTVIGLSTKITLTDNFFEYETYPQPIFDKNFERFIEQLEVNTSNNIENFIVADSEKQLNRIESIINDMLANRDKTENVKYSLLLLSLHEGFVCKNPAIACYTDHQIFERYHKFKLPQKYNGKNAYTLKEIYSLKPGDYVTHIDHGVGVFDGLEKINNNGKNQEAIRILYEGSDVLYVSIHSLHRISKYSSKEGHLPKIDKLGSNNWNRLKAKTKGKVKDIARDLIKLYAERRKTKGFAYSVDTYLQHELEASFIYEDTPDQIKTTLDVKQDMEADHPMDRLICGDVGFGKTEIAVRASFKAVADSKQVAIVVPTTILTVQHFNTFVDRLKDMPCKVDYINRFKSKTQQTETLKNLEAGKTDIIIGTHRLFSSDIKFKNLGLLIIDEEQKFGVSHKEKLKKLKSNVDTLTLTATPIPRTLQFSLMGARDLSIINTPPPNRYPVKTEVKVFDQTLIKETIEYELNRNGQVFFVNNRINNLDELALMISELVPYARVRTGHGQMDGKQLEKIMLDFIDGNIDVLVSTTIVESGIDIPNANTIIINDAHKYGLSDLHQLRGRVGRSNVKAFCYLLAPPKSVLTDDALKRLNTIEDFSEIGSGFHIAMRDLDIRGAGNILGAEQSGFISDIGFEMYHKILDEAIEELKIEEFSDILTEDINAKKVYTKECQIETDLELLIPDSYITNINERLSLYKDLDNCKDEKELIKFKNNLNDRFGKLPKSTEELIKAISLRFLAIPMGIEKIILKNNVLSLYFVQNSKNDFYNSDIFTKILQFVNNNYKSCSLKEAKEKIILTFQKINSTDQAEKIVKSLFTFVVEN